MKWFYLQNDGPKPLPAYTGKVIRAPEHNWENGPDEKGQKKLGDIPEMLRVLVELW